MRDAKASGEKWTLIEHEQSGLLMVPLHQAEREIKRFRSRDAEHVRQINQLKGKLRNTNTRFDEKDREIERLRGMDQATFCNVRYDAAFVGSLQDKLAAKDAEAAELRASLQAAKKELAVLGIDPVICCQCGDRIYGDDEVNQLKAERDAAIQRAEKAEHRERVAQRALSSADCQYAGRVAEMSGSHCPLGEPCDRCAAERREEKLESALAAARKALEKLRNVVRKASDRKFKPDDTETRWLVELPMTDEEYDVYRAALERINGGGHE